MGSMRPLDSWFSPACCDSTAAHSVKGAAFPWVRPALRACLSTLALSVVCASIVAMSPAGRISAQVASTTAVVKPTIRRAASGLKTYSHDSTAFDRAPQFEVASGSIVAFGGARGDPEYDLTFVEDVALLRSGGLAAFPRSTGLMFFTPDGRGSHIVGRQGQGPGEFNAGRMIPLNSDTFLVLDRGNARLTWIRASSGLLRTESINKRVPPSIYRAVGELPGQVLVLTSAGSWTTAAPSVRRDHTMASIVTLSPGSQSVEIASIPDLPLKLTAIGSGAQRIHEPESVRLGTAANLVVWDTLIASGDGSSYRIDLRNRSGKVVATIAVQTQRRPVTNTVRAAAITFELAELEAHLSSLPNPEGSRRVVREAPYSDSLPAFSRLFPSTVHTLWVLDGNTRFDKSWTATEFNRVGAIVRRLHGLGLSRPVAFADDKVLLRSVDQNGVVSFEMHRITPAKPR